MSIHKDEFGPYSAAVFFYIDRWGNIPEAGDRARDFEYAPTHPRWGYKWRDWILKAQNAIARAHGALV